MYLKRLSDGGFSEWRSMWNREILPYLRSLRPVAGPGLRIDRRPGGAVIRAVPTLAKAATAANTDFYHSYFKLKLSRSSEGVYSVRIADGATDGNSVAVVNGYTAYRLPPYTETVEGDRLFYLKYTPATYWNTGAVNTSATLEIASRGPEGSGALVLPDGGTDGAFCFQLGRVLWNNGSPRAIQDHTAGVADIRWYAKC